jgi:SNF2 family DNA or RNA helicase
VESDWTPALILQAIDRQHRFGQEHPVTARMLMAVGTLDEHVQATLANKGETVSHILGDSSNRVAVGGDRDLLGPADIVLGLVQKVIASLR